MTVPSDPGATPDPSTDPRSDRELLAAHVADGPDARSAFPELVRRHRQRMWNIALRTLRNREDAADALQDGFVRALRAAENFRGDAEVSTWLHRIVLNVCLDRIDARRRRPAVSLDDGDRAPTLPEPRDTYAEIDARSSVAQLLSRLPDEQRLAVILVDVEGFPVAEAADRLGIAVGTVKSRCARGRARLATELARARATTGGRPGGGDHL